MRWYPRLRAGGRYGNNRWKSDSQGRTTELVIITKTTAMYGVQNNVFGASAEAEPSRVAKFGLPADSSF